MNQRINVGRVGIRKCPTCGRRVPNHRHHYTLKEVMRLREALEFYADPETYHAMLCQFDYPAGGFESDFDEDPDYGRPMPGKRAREALIGK